MAVANPDSPLRVPGDVTASWVPTDGVTSRVADRAATSRAAGSGAAASGERSTPPDVLAGLNISLIGSVATETTKSIGDTPSWIADDQAGRSLEQIAASRRGD